MTQFPTNFSPLSAIDLQLMVPRLPLVSYWVQKANLPAITLPATPQFTPTQPIPIHGGPLKYAPLNVEFLVDEDMANYIEMTNWFIEIGEPDDLNQYTNFANTSCDISMVIFDSNKRPNIEVRYEAAIPVSLSMENLFSSTYEMVEYQTASLTFEYRRYFITKL